MMEEMEDENPAGRLQAGSDGSLPAFERIQPGQGDPVLVCEGEAQGHRGVLRGVIDGEGMVDTDQLGIKLVPLAHLTRIAPGPAC